MNYDKHEYYKNKHGVDLNEYLKATFTFEELFPWYLLQAVKYKVRAGKKTYNSYEEDMKKYKDYAAEAMNLVAIENYGVEYSELEYEEQNEIGTEIVEWIEEFVANFKKAKPE